MVELSTASFPIQIELVTVRSVTSLCTQSFTMLFSAFCLIRLPVLKNTNGISLMDTYWWSGAVLGTLAACVAAFGFSFFVKGIRQFECLIMLKTKHAAVIYRKLPSASLASKAGFTERAVRVAVQINSINWDHVASQLIVMSKSEIST